MAGSSEPLRRVLVVGLGTIGQQVALQAARWGYRVSLYDAAAAAYDTCRQRNDELLHKWMELGRITAAEMTPILERIEDRRDADDAARDADLLIECVPENRRLKVKVFGEFDKRCPPTTIFVTNTSYLMPSMLTKGMQRADRFAALHFHDPVWYANVVDIMPHAGTSAETVARLDQFARSIDQIPILCRKESPGYVFNAMLQGFLKEAMRLVTTGVCSLEDVDRAWMAVLKMSHGPFGILDRIGLDTAHDAAHLAQLVSQDPQERKNAELLESLVKQGRLGTKTGQGFYQYPNPAFEQPGFLQGQPPTDADSRQGS